MIHIGIVIAGIALGIAQGVHILISVLKWRRLCHQLCPSPSLRHLRPVEGFPVAAAVAVAEAAGRPCASFQFISCS